MMSYLLSEERFAITDVGVHGVDLARVFFGEAGHITAELQNRNPRAVGEDTATMMLRHTAGAVSVVEVSYGARGLPDPFPATLLEIEGDRGAIRMGADYQIRVTSDGRQTQFDGDAPLLPWTERPWHVVQESVYNTCRHILERFRAGQPADVSGTDNLRTYALCDAAYGAAASRRAERPIA